MKLLHVLLKTAHTNAGVIDLDKRTVFIPNVCERFNSRLSLINRSVNAGYNLTVENAVSAADPPDLCL